MKQRDSHMKTIRSLVINKLIDITQNKQYSELLKYLIAQGLQTLIESNVTIQCRKSDLKLVQSVLHDGIEIYQNNLKQATGITPVVHVKIDESNFLPAAPKSSDDTQLSCVGGVILSANNGEIVCKNTLDNRLDIALERLRPQLRSIIWGETKKSVHAAKENKH